MTDLHAADDHATPLKSAEREDLIPTHITLRSELNELEQQNIATGNRWAFGRRHVVTRESFLKSLHRRMFERRLTRSRCDSITGSSPSTPFPTETAVGLVSRPTF
jgi:hypothetical protein